MNFGPWAIYNPCMAKLENNYFISQIIMNFDDVSENLCDIGSMEFKLWQLKESPKLSRHARSYKMLPLLLIQTRVMGNQSFKNRLNSVKVTEAR